MRLTKQQKVRRAVERMESAAVDMIRSAEVYGNRPDETGRRRDLLATARRYAASVDAVSRARTRKISARPGLRDATQGRLAARSSASAASLQ